MKLNNGDRIHYDGSVYEVVAVLWSTLYLRAAEDGSQKYDYEMAEIQNFYKDIEFLQAKKGF